MAVIHRTTMDPTKLQLLAGWLPGRPWYRGGGAPPERAGGFRLDDPAGEVGAELMLVAAGGTVHFVPLAYRGAPLAGAEEGLVGTSEHGVLGTRWVYDAAHDPVVMAQLLALLQGRAQAQHQDESHRADPGVGVEPGPAGPVEVPSAAPVPADGDLVTSVDLGDAAGGAGRVVVDLLRVPGDDPGTVTGAAPLGRASAGWRVEGGPSGRGVVARAHLLG
ncbi:maltokinase N-terminal cap-like domain-containing protein [Vallicoccus soli]|uniref:1,4-alpha-glucan branching protein n=1 Tax=Vallicoccus soli TaxID=2339232 RepID=A0A3A3YVS7_9ACTN|nr:1,4-alpha-glucan branching protein [Vallicoccus soli]RJK94869.1 1,4-alpha-glucan branching protein [Vallicoccus soli]